MNAEKERTLIDLLLEGRDVEDDKKSDAERMILDELSALVAETAGVGDDVKVATEIGDGGKLTTKLAFPHAQDVDGIAEKLMADFSAETKIIQYEIGDRTVCREIRLEHMGSRAIKKTERNLSEEKRKAEAEEMKKEAMDRYVESVSESSVVEQDGGKISKVMEEYVGFTDRMLGNDRAETPNEPEPDVCHDDPQETEIPPKRGFFKRLFGARA